MAVNAKVASAYVDLVARTEAFQKALQDANVMTRRFSAQTRADMHEARGGIMLLSEEIGVHIPRHLQAFIAKLPGVSAAMSAAFNSVAVLAMIEVVVKGGEKLYEFIKKNEEAAGRNAKAYGELSDSLEKQNLQLQVGNDKLDASIAKLEGKPTNGLKTALDEARLAAFDLAAELEKTIDKERELLDASNANLLQRTLGAAGNESVKTGLSKYEAAQIGEEQRYQDELNPNSWSVADDLRGRKLTAYEAQLEHEKKVTEITEKYYNDLEAEITKRTRYQELRAGFKQNGMSDEYFQLEQEFKNSHSAGDQTNILQSLQNLKEGIGTIGWTQQGEVDRDIKSHTLARLQDAKNATDAEKKAAEERLKAFESTFDQQKQLYGMDVYQDLGYWQGKLSAFKNGTEQYLTVLGKYAAAEKQLRAIEVKADKNNLAEPAGFGVASSRGEDQLDEAIKRAAIAQATLNEDWTVARDRLGLLTGDLAPHQAALNLAAAHADEYSAKLAALREQMAALQDNDELASILGPDLENQAKQVGLQTQIAELEGKRRIQEMEDGVFAFGTTWKGMVDGIFWEVIRRGEETQQQLARIATQTIDSLNTELAKSMTGQKTNYSRVFQQAAEQLAKAGLEKVESAGAQLLGAGGHKKADGYHMWVDNLPSSDAMNAIDSVFPKPKISGPGGSMIASAASSGLMGWLNDSNWASSLFGGKLFGAGSFFGGGHALGGAVEAGIPIDVGELGRERFTPMVPGRITSNRDLGRGAPAIGYIDARGTDPSLTRANFERALQASHASAVHQAGVAMAERQRRMPQ